MKRVRILIADDHAVVRRGLRTLLEAQPGWKVCGEALTGKEAVGKAGKLKPDIVILDISMPELNGIEATPLILKAAPKTHVIILTMHNAEEMIEKVLRSGARGFVLKSDAERDLVLAVDTVMQNKPFLTSTVSEAVLRSFQQPENQAHQRQQNQDRLTKRERQVVRLLAEGKSNKEAAAVLVLSTRTVESHRATITRKLGARSFSDLLRYAIRNKLIDL